MGGLLWRPLWSGFSRELFVARMTTIGFTRRMKSSRLKPLLQERPANLAAAVFCECHHRRRTMRAAAFPRAAESRHVDDLLLSPRSEEHTSELQSLMRISYAVFCCKKKK